MMNELAHLKNWLELPNTTKRNAYQETGAKVGLSAIAVEKDWWIVHTLAVIFSMDYADFLIFKGGTSLSKGWNLIQRFSEDIDLALDKRYLGFEGDLSLSQIRKLRRKSYEFITKKFVTELQKKFFEIGFESVNIKYREVKNHDQDPLIIEIYYPKLTETDTYLKPGLLVEISSRSLKEPFTEKTFSSLVAENYPTLSFADKPIKVPIVNPERTFLEKIFLLHEEFQKPQEKIRVERLSRHLYDIEKLMPLFAEIALKNADLYQTIVAHRRHFMPVSGVNYDNHIPSKINFVPPNALLPLWETDYKQMQLNMIYGESLSFATLIKKLTELQAQINNLK